MSVLEEMTDEQLEEGLVRANEQLQAFLSRQMAGSGPRKLGDRAESISSVLQSTLKLQNTVRAIETEIRRRESEPSGLSARFEMKMSPEQKQWVLANGGAAKLRALVDQARQ